MNIKYIIRIIRQEGSFILELLLKKCFDIHCIFKKPQTFIHNELITLIKIPKYSFIMKT